MQNAVTNAFKKSGIGPEGAQVVSKFFTALAAEPHSGLVGVALTILASVIADAANLIAPPVPTS